MKRTVIRHKTDGIFVGQGMGLAFFTLMDTAGQPEVISFDSAEDAYTAMREIGFDETYVADCVTHDVELDDKHYGEYIGPSYLKEAGLGEYLGDLESNFQQMLEGKV